MGLGRGRSEGGWHHLPLQCQHRLARKVAGTLRALAGWWVAVCRMRPRVVWVGECGVAMLVSRAWDGAGRRWLAPSDFAMPASPRSEGGWHHPTVRSDYPTPDTKKPIRSNVGTSAYWSLRGWLARCGWGRLLRCRSWFAATKPAMGRGDCSRLLR